MADLIERAKAALDAWDNTTGVTIEVTFGMVAAEEHYRNAPELVRDLVAEIERQRGVDALLDQVAEVADTYRLIEDTQILDILRPTEGQEHRG